MSASQRARSAVPLDMRSAVPSLPGVPWWGALLLAVGVTGVGVLVDATRGDRLTSAFTVCYVLGCVLAVVAVRYRGLFTAMAQPPLLLLVAVPLGQELVASGSTTGLRDLALNVAYPLVNRFPAMLLATVAVLAIGGARIVATRQNAGVRARAPRARRSAAPRRGTDPASRPRAATRPARTPAAADRAAENTPGARASRPAPARKASPRTARDATVTTTKASVRDVADTRADPVVRRRAATPPPRDGARTRRPDAARRAEVPPPAAPHRAPAPHGAPVRPAPGYPPPQVRYRDRDED